MSWGLGPSGYIQLPPVDANEKLRYCPDTLTNATFKWDHIFLLPASAVPELNIPTVHIDA